MPFVKVYIHFVWSTKNREDFLSTVEIRNTVWKHIRENAKQKGIFIDFINGYSDHCHCLVSLGIDQTMSNVMQLIKGESSFWINKQGILNELPTASLHELSTASAVGIKKKIKFGWQDEYYAMGVSESMIDKTRNYIKNQEEHHRKVSYNEECDDIIKKYGFEKFTG